MDLRVFLQENVTICEEMIEVQEIIDELIDSSFNEPSFIISNLDEIIEKFFELKENFSNIQIYYGLLN